MFNGQLEHIVFQTTFRFQNGRTRLTVPQGELVEIDAVRVRHRRAEIVAGHGLPVVALEIELHAFLEALFAEQGVIHPHHFRAFFINGHGVEIVHLLIAGGAHRMRGRACVFGKLVLAQQADVFDAAYGAAGAVAGKFLVAEHGQPFLQRKLEPVAAGNAVACPVVEIFVSDHRFDAFEIGIGGGAAVGKDELGVKDVQTLVFHRAHIEIAYGNDHENIQVVFQTEARFVPFHCVFQRFHGKANLGLVRFGGVKLDFDVSAAHGGETVFRYRQIACNQSKQITRFGKRVFPFHPMAAV